MKKILTLGLIAVMVVSTFSAPALSAIRLKGGYFMPNGNDIEGEKFPENGLIYGAEMSTVLTGGILGLGLGVDYFQYDKTVGGSDATLQLIPASATLYFYPPITGLYLGAGAGYYIGRLKVTPNPGWPEDSAYGAKLGYHGVVGYNLTKHLFLEGRYSSCEIKEWKSGGTSVDTGGLSDVGGVSLFLGLSI